MFDLEGVMQGTVPWSAEECREVMEWYHRLVNTPKDDWDLEERSIALEHESGDVSNLKFNQFQPMNQFGFYMAERYDQSVMPYHTFRFMQITDFLTEHTTDLQIDGFARESEGGAVEICTEVLRALCELPYSQIANTDQRGERRTFNYEEVVSRVRGLQSEEEKNSGE